MSVFSLFFFHAACYDFMDAQHIGDRSERTMIRGIASLPDFVVLVFVYFIVFYRKWKEMGHLRLFLRTVFYCYLCMVVYFTLMPVLASIPNFYLYPAGTINLSPFIDIAEGHLNAETEIILNILMMIPFGFLLPLIMQRSPLAIISAGFLTSLAIECIQPFLNPYRAADITDLITNTVGTIIGYFLYRLLREHIQNMLNRIMIS